MRNVISANRFEGVDVRGDTATGNRILSNYIFSNGGLGIDLGVDSPIPNRWLKQTIEYAPEAPTSHGLTSASAGLTKREMTILRQVGHEQRGDRR